MGTDVYIQANLIDSRLIVSATRPKIARIDEIVAQVESKEDDLFDTPVIPKFEYELLYADPYDAADNLEVILEILWDGKEMPRVDYSMFGDVNLLVVKHPDESSFPKIKEWITKYIDKEPEGGGIRQKVVPPPKAVSPTQMALWFQMHHPDLDIEIEDITPKEKKTWGTEELLPPEPGDGSPCVLPTAYGRMVHGVLAGAVGQAEPDEDDEPDQGAGNELAEDDTVVEEAVEEEPTGDVD
ncbi:MAG: hypothetical protein ACYTFA_14325, partial [Planctomycetota bacterium]